ncbi:hypothetical protein HanRHA438_Chr05g0218041 [Helianthus annuus]|nr:hypothetical protein HanRHA438_Chr05g0218041 [Helianthus annuus]
MGSPIIYLWVPSLFSIQVYAKYYKPNGFLGTRYFNLNPPLVTNAFMLNIFLIITSY